MAQICLDLIIICYTFGLLCFAIWDVKKKWKLPKAEKQKNATKYYLACLVLYSLGHFGQPYAARVDYETEMQKATDIIKQAGTLMGQSDELKECKRKLELREYAHVAAYETCQEPFIMAAYKQAGVKHSDSLQSLSKIWLAMAIKSDKGEPISQEAMGKKMMDVIQHDVSEP